MRARRFRECSRVVGEGCVRPPGLAQCFWTHHPCMWGRGSRSWSWNPSAPPSRGRGGIPVSSDSHEIPTLSVQSLVVYCQGKKGTKREERKFHYKLLIKAQASSLPSTFPSLLPSFFLFFFISRVERPRECKQRISQAALFPNPRKNMFSWKLESERSAWPAGASGSDRDVIRAQNQSVGFLWSSEIAAT